MHDLTNHFNRSHATKFLRDQLLAHYKTNPEGFAIFETWMHAFLRGKDLWSFCRRVDDAVLIAGKKYLTPSVKAAIMNIGRATRRIGKQIVISVCFDCKVKIGVLR
jgi:hypothetical protein